MHILNSVKSGPWSFKAAVIMLFEGKQVTQLGLFLWQECHTSAGAKAKKKKKKADGQEKVFRVYASQHFGCLVS